MARKRLQKERSPTIHELPPLRLACVFYRTDSGNEPVRDWLKEDVAAAPRRTIGGDIKTVQATWPIDKPLVDHLGPGLWEVRSTHDEVDYRVVFMLDGNAMVLLHGFSKGSAKPRRADVDLALDRKARWEKMK